MQFIRCTALVLLWALAGLGVLCGAVWGASALGLFKPLIVISGSMEPGIMTGDLLIGVQVDTANLRPGDVASLPSTVTHDLVTHRIETIEPVDGGQWQVTMKGDNNADIDSAPYVVGETSLVPKLQLGGWGTAIQRMTHPLVEASFLIGLLALLGIVLLFPAAPTRRPAPAAAVVSAPATAPMPAPVAAPPGGSAPEVVATAGAPQPLTRRQLSGRELLPSGVAEPSRGNPR